MDTQYLGEAGKQFRFIPLFLVSGVNWFANELAPFSARKGFFFRDVMWKWVKNVEKATFSVRLKCPLKSILQEKDEQIQITIRGFEFDTEKH